MIDNKIRCIVYGQQCIGKTSLILKYLNLPTQHQNIPYKKSFVKTELLNNEIVCLSIEKISREEDLTIEEILKSDICILTFAVNDPISFAYIIHGRSIICKYKPDMPIIIVATKSDLRSLILTSASCIDISRVHTFVSEIGAYAYFEISIFSQDESSLLFMQAIKIIKLVSSFNTSMKLQTDSPVQRIFSSFKSILNKANNIIRQQATKFIETNEFKNESDKMNIEKLKASKFIEEAKYDEKMQLLSTISATDLGCIDMSEKSDNSKEKESFV